MKKIYFCGSIRGGRADAAYYRTMVDRLKLYGDVLTEHVADQNLTAQGGDGTNEFIYQRDTNWLHECDVLVAECTTPSLGVGYELAYGEALGKPVHVFFRTEFNSRRLSALVAGNPGFDVQEYFSEQDLIEKIDALFQ